MQQVTKFRNIALKLRQQIVPVCNFSKQQQAPKQEEQQPVKPKFEQVDRYSLTPHQYYITQGKAMERPFTGKIWYEKDVGYYHCTVCQSKLFSFDKKFQNNSGMAQFWNHVDGAVQVKEIGENDTNCVQNFVNSSRQEEDKDKEIKRCECSNCGGHLGLVFFDGPPPTFMRYSINSASAEFKIKEHWKDPNELKRLKKEKGLKEKPLNFNNE